jgi:hypothetical protein
MNFEEDRITFQEVDGRYVELKRQREAEAISDEEFDERLRELMVLDEEGRWWAKSRTTGRWYYNHNGSWIRRDPPGHYPPPSELPVDDVPERPSPVRQGGASARGFLDWLMSNVLAPVESIELIIVPCALAFGFYWGWHDTLVENVTDLKWLFQITLYIPSFLVGFFGRLWYLMINVSVLSVSLCLMIWILAVQYNDFSYYKQLDVPLVPFSDYFWIAVVAAIVSIIGFGIRRLLRVWIGNGR